MPARFSNFVSIFSYAVRTPPLERPKFMSELITLTADIVASFVENNSVSVGDLPGLITATHGALAGLGEAAEAVPAEPVFVAAVTVRKSLASPDALISMIDGKPYKMLKRHLSGNGLTPDEYRARYNLPRDYPMTAPSYTQTRRDLAVKIGLGRKPGDTKAKRTSAAKKPA